MCAHTPTMTKTIFYFFNHFEHFGHRLGFSVLAIQMYPHLQLIFFMPFDLLIKSIILHHVAVKCFFTSSKQAKGLSTRQKNSRVREHTFFHTMPRRPQPRTPLRGLGRKIGLALMIFSEINKLYFSFITTISPKMWSEYNYC